MKHDKDAFVLLPSGEAHEVLRTMRRWPSLRKYLQDPPTQVYDPDEKYQYLKEPLRVFDGETIRMDYEVRGERLRMKRQPYKVVELHENADGVWEMGGQ